MRRTFVAVGALVAASFAEPIEAQSRPDFSGRWTLVSSAPQGRGALGQEFTITQDATTLTLDTTASVMSGSTTAAGSTSFTSTPYSMRAVFTLDGGEHPHRVVGDPPNRPTGGNVQMMLSSKMEESTSKAIWTGRQLVIMTHDKSTVTARNQVPAQSVQRRTVRQVFSLDADGTLIVEKLVVADPMPSEREAPSPATVRSVYKKN